MARRIICGAFARLEGVDSKALRMAKIAGVDSKALRMAKIAGLD